MECHGLPFFSGVIFKIRFVATSSKQHLLQEAKMDKFGQSTAFPFKYVPHACISRLCKSSFALCCHSRLHLDNPHCCECHFDVHGQGMIIATQVSAAFIVGRRHWHLLECRTLIE
jgi:hypothetical protein